jgi:SPP1 family predicted phage head-tail adaptor
MNVNINNLDKRISIQKCNSETNETTIIHECWAQVSNISGTEIIKNQVEFEQATTRFLIRYTDKPLSTDMQIEFNGRIYDISYTNDYGFSHEFIEIMAIMRSWSVADEG